MAGAACTGPTMAPRLQGPLTACHPGVLVGGPLPKARPPLRVVLRPTAELPRAELLARGGPLTGARPTLRVGPPPRRAQAIHEFVTNAIERPAKRGTSRQAAARALLESAAKVPASMPRVPLSLGPATRPTLVWVLAALETVMNSAQAGSLVMARALALLPRARRMTATAARQPAPRVTDMLPATETLAVQLLLAWAAAKRRRRRVLAAGSLNGGQNTAVDLRARACVALQRGCGVG